MLLIILLIIEGGFYPGDSVHDVGHVRVVHLAYQQPEHLDSSFSFFASIFSNECNLKPENIYFGQHPPI